MSSTCINTEPLFFFVQEVDSDRSSTGVHNLCCSNHEPGT
uniref:Uncharacterized protein n=1 Tax=Anguilla anguilla TaxID=7936 RepID=A0A0E9VFQ5_ANGAN